MKFSYSTGRPFTPYNDDGTQNVDDYLTQRFDPFHSLDVRFDRRWDFNGWSLITYLDIQNIYNNKNGNFVFFIHRNLSNSFSLTCLQLMSDPVSHQSPFQLTNVNKCKSPFFVLIGVNIYRFPVDIEFFAGLQMTEMIKIIIVPFI